jgi:hypothetical protein
MKTASRVLLTFAILVFFTGITFSQVASTTKPATKATTDNTVKATDCGKTANCTNGKAFVDKNADGKCDNCGVAGKCKDNSSCGSKGHNCGTSCDKGKGTGSCGSQEQPNKSGCASKCSAPASCPKK